jgi:hypothetical protein
MGDLMQKYLDKILVDPTLPEVLPPDYNEWLDKMTPTTEEREEMARERQSAF